MNPVNEKVKDIVNVLDFKSVKDFDLDPKATLAGYHFTDITSEMMGRWLDRISMVHARGGDCYAMAGYRGVGKSHFLATLGAIVSHTELRSVVADPHVAAGAQRLLRRHYPVVHVRRGTADTLLKEFEDAVAREFPGKEFKADGKIETILKFIDEVTGEMPAVILVDTAFERGVRVSRDDGQTLGKIAELIKEQNIFIGVALDDDIAGADGVNADIARTYNITYLDTEHLYTVVNRHVFPKHPGKEQVLSNVYRYFRKVLPNFRWSEQKFASLYPLHPSILEVAPFIRLHVHDFAVLGFASEAGERILGRPASSLIALDEVFDKVEHDLRVIDDLKEPFAAYDQLNKEVVSKIPVMQRLQAKLILKALLLLSLDGRGASAAEIAESMLIFDEADPEKAYTNIEKIISQFAAAMPDDIRQITLEGRESKYGFRMSSKDELNIALDDAAARCDAKEIGDTVAKLLQDRFPDGSWSGDQSGRRSVECTVGWRGSIRRGRLSFITEESELNSEGDRSLGLDWNVKVELFDHDQENDNWGTALEADTVIWRPDNLSLSEKDTLRRYHVLTNNAEIRAKFSEQLHAPLQSHSVAASRILKRSFLDDGKLVVSGFDFNFSDEAREAQSLGELFTTMLTTFFDTRFPDHPEFGAILGPSESASLIAGLYGGAESPGFDELIHNFAVPLGLVRLSEGRFESQPFEHLIQIPVIDRVYGEIASKNGEMISLEDISSIFGSAPFGFVREGQRVLLTSLVAARKIDFVTSKGDRINKKSLDLRIIWDDIVGVALSVENVLSKDRLVHWATVLSGNPEFKNFSDKSDVLTLRNSLELWLREWRRERILDRFENLPDDVFNTRIWRTAASAAKTFTVLAEIIGQILEGELEPDTGISQAAGLFSDSDDEYARRIGELDTLRHFVSGTYLRDEILNYSSFTDSTGDPAIEALRRRLIDAAELCILDPAEARNREAGLLFEKFRKDFTSHYTSRHDEVMHAHHLQEKFSAVIASDDWNQFQALAQNGLVPMAQRKKVQEYEKRFKDLDCRFDTAAFVWKFGSCQCSFSLDTLDSWAWLPSELMGCLASTLENFRKEVADDRDRIIGSLQESSASADADVSTSTADLIARLKGNKLDEFNLIDASILASAIIEIQQPKRNQETGANGDNFGAGGPIDIDVESLELIGA